MDATKAAIPRVGVAVCVLQDGKILLGKRRSKLGHGLWSVCGGHLEDGEDVLECARRELLEEAGLEAVTMRLGGSFSGYIDQKLYHTHYVFIYSFTGTVENREPEKCEGWQWFSDENLPEPFFPTVAALFRSHSTISALSAYL